MALLEKGYKKMDVTTDFPEYKMTKRRVLTKRGVLWLGQTCNLRCHFCYFLNRIDSTEHPEHPFMSIDKAKKICSTLVDFYGNNAIDIQGGEPTIYKDIFELISYCRKIGLLPTLITNALVLSNKTKCRKFKAAGIRDFLISVHGLGETFNQIVGGISRGSEKQMKGIDNCLEMDIPLRFNCVLSKMSLPQLPDIAKFSIEKRVRAVNFIAFNPFEDQRIEGKRSVENVPKYSEVAEYLNKAMDILEDAHIECNVRYFPICMVAERHRKSMYNFQQLSYDLHEWDYASWSWTGMRSQRMKWGGVAPVVTLEYATHGGNDRVDGMLYKIKKPLGKLISPFPSLLPPAVRIYQTISKSALGILKTKKDANPDLEALYRANGRMRAQKHSCYTYGEKCHSCNIKNICDGFHGDYAKFFGADEAKPIKKLPKIDDPKYFIKEQDKVVEVEDYNWAY